MGLNLKTTFGSFLMDIRLFFSTQPYHKTLV